MDFLDEIRQKTTKGKATLGEIRSLGIVAERKKTFPVIGLAVRAPAINLDVKAPEIKTPEINPAYSVILTEEQDHPFSITSKGIQLAQEITKRADSDMDKAQDIFNWLDDNIRYGKSFKLRKGYLTAKEVMAQGKGICAETAYLFIVLARAVGLKANWVHVDKDYHGKKVNHACAAVYCDGDDMEILVDLAYHQFDIEHKDYQIVDDQEAIRHFHAVAGH